MQHMRVPICAAVFCSSLNATWASDERACAGLQTTTVFMPMGNCQGADTVDDAENLGCFLREFCDNEGDLTTTEDAAACEQRCKEHVKGRFRRTCSHWSWGAREGNRFYQKCFMTTKTGRAVHNRRFTSGNCDGGVLPNSSKKLGSAGDANHVNETPSDARRAPSDATDFVEHGDNWHGQEHRDYMFREKIMESVDSLRVWLKIEHRVTLADDKLKDLYLYMGIQNMTTACPGFPAALAAFEPPAPHEETLYEKMYDFVFSIVDFLTANMTAIVTVVTFLSPLLFQMGGCLLETLDQKAPAVGRQLDLLLPDDLKKAKLKAKVDVEERSAKEETTKE